MTNRRRIRRATERGISLLELTFSTIVLVTSIFATIEFSRLLWAHNALNDAVRKGAEYAISHTTTTTTTTAIKNLVVYNNVAGGTNAVAPGLTTSILVQYGFVVRTEYLDANVSRDPDWRDSGQYAADLVIPFLYMKGSKCRSI